MPHRQIRLLFVLIVSLAIPLFSQALPHADKINFAVTALKPCEGISAGEAEIIADRLRIDIFSTGKVNILEREEMKNILKEQGFQASGSCDDEACLVEVGKMLGVQRIVAGTIGRLGNMYLLNFRVIDVQTSRIHAVVSHDVNGSIDQVVINLPYIANRLVDSSYKRLVVSEQNAVMAEQNISADKGSRPEYELKPKVKSTGFKATACKPASADAELTPVFSIGYEMRFEFKICVLDFGAGGRFTSDVAESYPKGASGPYFDLAYNHKVFTRGARNLTVGLGACPYVDLLNEADIGLPIFLQAGLFRSKPGSRVKFSADFRFAQNVLPVTIETENIGYYSSGYYSYTSSAYSYQTVYPTEIGLTFGIGF